MPLPSSQGTQFVTNRLIREEMEYDSVSKKQLFNELHSGLSSKQLEVYDTIMNAYNCKKGGLFFLYGNGGTRKTYLWKTLIAKFRSEKKLSFQLHLQQLRLYCYQEVELRIHALKFQLIWMNS